MLEELKRLFQRTSLMKEAFDESIDMLRGCQEMVSASIKSLRHTDTANLEINIQSKDRQINAYEQDVRRKVLTHLATGAAGDLNMGLILTSVIISIERIGDYSKNIVELAQTHPAKLSAGSWDKEIKTMETKIQISFNELIVALKTDNREKALNIYDDLDNVTKTCDRIIFAIIKGQADNFSVANAVTLALYLRYLKRIGAHLKNIATGLFNPFDQLGFYKN